MKLSSVGRSREPGQRRCRRGRTGVCRHYVPQTDRHRRRQRYHQARQPIAAIASGPNRSARAVASGM